MALHRLPPVRREPGVVGLRCAGHPAGALPPLVGSHVAGLERRAEQGGQALALVTSEVKHKLKQQKQNKSKESSTVQPRI